MSPKVVPRATRSGSGHARPCFASGLAVALLAFACAPAAWASYGQMRLEGVTFFLAVALLYLWCVPLAAGIGLGWGRHKVFVGAATVVTCVLTALLLAVFGDGRATMQQRPLGIWAMFVVLLLAAVPAMLAAPLLQRAWLARGAFRLLPTALVIGIIVFVPAGSVMHFLLQTALEQRTLAQVHALAPGQILPHVAAARQRAAASWLSPYIWNEAEETKWLITGVGKLGFVESSVPLADSDTQALELLVRSYAGTGSPWQLEGKLVWDRLMRATPPDRLAVAAGLTKSQALYFNQSIGVPHAGWLCAPLADPETKKAFDHLARRLPEDESHRYAAAIQEKCGLVEPPRLPIENRPNWRVVEIGPVNVYQEDPPPLGLLRKFEATTVSHVARAKLDAALRDPTLWTRALPSVSRAQALEPAGADDRLHLVFAAEPERVATVAGQVRGRPVAPAELTTTRQWVAEGGNNAPVYFRGWLRLEPHFEATRVTLQLVIDPRHWPGDAAQGVFSAERMAQALLALDKAALERAPAR